MKVLTFKSDLANVLLQDPENMIWYTGHSLKLCCVVTVMQRQYFSTVKTHAYANIHFGSRLWFEINFVFMHGLIKI